MNELILQTRLLRHVLMKKNHAAAITNSTQLLWSEVDLLSVTKAGLVHEYEIKCSKADYRAEFNGKSYAKTRKHNRLLMGYAAGHGPNYFWFVTYEFDIEPPEYAGWILAAGEQYGIALAIKKQAPRLHKEKWDSDRVAKIARLLSFRLLTEYERRKDVIPYLTRVEVQ